MNGLLQGEHVGETIAFFTLRRSRYEEKKDQRNQGSHSAHGLHPRRTRRARRRKGRSYVCTALANGFLGFFPSTSPERQRRDSATCRWRSGLVSRRLGRDSDAPAARLRMVLLHAVFDFVGGGVKNFANLADRLLRQVLDLLTQAFGRGDSPWLIF